MAEQPAWNPNASIAWKTDMAVTFAWRVVLALTAAAIVLTLFAAGAMPARAHDLAAWSDPVRDDWYRSLKVPGRSTSCCDLTDAARIDPDKVRQERDGSWSVDLGSGFVPVPPERVVRYPPSIDGLPYVFLMNAPTIDSPNRIRCFVPSVGTY